MNFTGCIFDLDGTLADTQESLQYSANLALSKLSLSPITLEQSREYIGNGARKFIERSVLAGGGSEAMIDEALQIYREFFPTTCVYNVVPYEGMKEVLETLRKKGIKLAVFSNKPDRETKIVCEAVFGKDMFCYLQGQKDSIPHKPDPTGLYQVLEHMELEPRDCVYMGDSEVDIKVGLAAKLYTAGVGWGYREISILEKEGANRILNQPLEILELFAK